MMILKIMYKEVIKTRDPNRIDVFTSELNRVWKTYFCDLRFGQFMSNFFGWVVYTKKTDIFFPEENKMLTYLREYCGEKEEINGQV